jgi:hypothetical protein
MKRVVVRIGGVVMLVLVLSAAAASAQDAAGGAPRLLWSIEGTAGVQLAYTGTIQSVAFGFAPTRSLTLLIGAERSRTEDEIEFYPDGYASERGGLVEFVSAELRYAFFANKRVSPYALVGTGRGVERPNVNEFFPHGVDRKTRHRLPLLSNRKRNLRSCGRRHPPVSSLSRHLFRRLQSALSGLATGLLSSGPRRHEGLSLVALRCE